MVPTGFRFSPTDEELIEILNHKVSGNIVMAPLDFIVETNLYEVEPQHLQSYAILREQNPAFHGTWAENVAVNKNERYYFCKRVNDSREVTSQGWWKATSHVKIISSSTANGEVVGSKRPLTFHKFRSGDYSHNQRKRKDAIKTDWIMHEYGLESTPTKWKLCKIKYKGKERHKEDNINTPIMSSESGELSGSSTTNPMLLEFASEELNQPLPINNDYENYLWSTNYLSNMHEMIGYHQQQLELGQPYSSAFDPSCSMPYNYEHFAQQPFGDLWS